MRKPRILPSLAVLAISLILSIPAAAQELYDPVSHGYGDRTMGARFTSYACGQSGSFDDPRAVRQSQKTRGWNLGQEEEYTRAATLCTWDGNTGVASIGFFLGGQPVFQQVIPVSPLSPHRSYESAGWLSLRPIRRRLWGSLEVQSRSVLQYEHLASTSLASAQHPQIYSRTRTRVVMVVHARTLGLRNNPVLFTSRHEIMDGQHRSRLRAASLIRGYQ